MGEGGCWAVQSDETGSVTEQRMAFRERRSHGRRGDDRVPGVTARSLLSANPDLGPWSRPFPTRRLSFPI